jgi:hypothetical protein
LSRRVYRSLPIRPDVHSRRWRYCAVGARLLHTQLLGLQVYPLEDFLFIDAERDLGGDTAGVRATLHNVVSHIGLDPFPSSTSSNASPPMRRNTVEDDFVRLRFGGDGSRWGGSSSANSTTDAEQQQKQYQLQLTPQLLRTLGRFFERHNRAFYELAGRDFGWEAEVAKLAHGMEAAAAAAKSGSGAGAANSGSASSAGARAGSKSTSPPLSARSAYGGGSRDRTR